MVNIEYYIIKNKDGKYLFEDYVKDEYKPYFFTSLFYKAMKFNKRIDAVTFMKNNNIKGIVYKVFYQELLSLE